MRRRTLRASDAALACPALDGIGIGVGVGAALPSALDGIGVGSRFLGSGLPATD